jgi:hypothetical protein
MINKEGKGKGKGKCKRSTQKKGILLLAPNLYE